MADTKISVASDGSPAVAADQIPINRGGVGYRVNANTVGALALGRFIGQYQYTTSGAGNHTTQLSTTKVRFILVGGGGGGAGTAGNSGNAAFSGGGCAGGYTEHVIAVAANTAYAYTVGAGGAAAANNAVGGAGGETNITIGNVFRANGGAGGGNMANGATNSATTANANTAANAANTPAVNVGGQAGAQGWRQNGVIGASGDGGCSFFGGGGKGTQQRAATAGVKGENAVGWGSGGAGGCGNSNANGGNGANGIIIIDEFSG